MAKGGLDAEALKKHQFWIVLGAFAVLWIVAVVMVKVSANDGPKKKFDAAKTSIKGALSKGVKTEAYQKPWNEHGKKFRDHKDVIWKQAWDQQKDMYTWPDSMKIQPQYIDDTFGPTTETDLDNRTRYRTTWYDEQFVYAPDEKEKGFAPYVAPVEFAGGNFFGIFPKQVWDRGVTPTREEIWLAQEDYWVRREMLIIIRNALDSVALLKEVPPKDPKAKEELPPGVVLKKVFRNSIWELTLLFEPKEAGGKALVVSEKSTIKNINAAERTMLLANPKTNRGLPFRVVQPPGFFEIQVSGEPLPYGASTEIKKRWSVSPVDPMNATKPMVVEQVLDWEISPIRRIDQLALAHHSHRTVTAGLKVNEALKKLDPDPDGGTEGAPAAGAPGTEGAGATGSNPMAAMSKMGPSMGMGGAMGPGAGGGDVTRINGIPRERYMHVTPQCRHLPIAMRLVVDQAHIHDVLAAIANSRLRIQVTQVTLHHTVDQRPTPVAAAGGAAGGTTRPPTGGGTSGGLGDPGGMSGMMSAMMGRFGGGGSGGLTGRPFQPGQTGRQVGEGVMGGSGGAPGVAGGSGGQAAGGGMFQDTAQLVELSVYGIASLYERFPARAPKAADATTTTPTTETKQ